MTTTAEKIEIMQAFEDGESIEFMSPLTDNWLSCGHPSWDWATLKYRIKPQPKVIYVNEYGAKDILSFYDKCHTLKAGSGNVKTLAQVFIELTPELEKLAKEGGLL